MNQSLTMERVIAPQMVRQIARVAPDTWSPKSLLGEAVKRCMPHLPDELAVELLDRIQSSVVCESQLSVVIFRACQTHGVWDCACPDLARRTEDYGIVSRKLVTTAGVGYIIDAFQNLVELENLKYHGLGTDATAEAVGQTGLIAELTTQYSPDNTRATGTTTEGASSNIYRTVATNTLDAGATIEEHGVFSQAATGGGVLLDRSLTGTKSLGSGEGLQSTYEYTLNAGG